MQSAAKRLNNPDYQLNFMQGAMQDDMASQIMLTINKSSFVQTRLHSCVPYEPSLRLANKQTKPYSAARQTALKRQDLSRTYLAHHELESFVVIINITIIII